MEDLIANSNLAIRAMGHWPSFHDARVKEAERNGDACVVLIHVNDLTGEIDTHGHYVSTNHHLVTIQMSGIVECTLPPDYRTDVLFDLSAERLESRIKLVFESAVGPEFTWHTVCEQAAVTTIVPCSQRGEPVR